MTKSMVAVHTHLRFRIYMMILLLFAAGSLACMSYFESSFSSRFSLQELVKRNQSAGGLNCSAGGGGGGGIGAGSGGIGRTGSSYHKSEGFSCQITDPAQFDAAKFTQILKESVEKDLDACQARIVGSANRDANSFSIDYALGNLTGRLEISGIRSLGNYYNLQADLDEKSNVK